ncbi:MAG TPA: hypothetical protein VFV30_11235 [Novosphingobium sp.]|nr:hypothetical protein [Novosphingobium sp.]
MTKKLMAAAAAFAMTATPVLAAGETQAAPVRDAAPVAQSEQLFDGDGGGWLLFVLLGAAAVVGLIVAMDDPASP